MSKDNYEITGKMTINYGLNKVRFLDAVMPGSRIGVRSELVNTEKFSEDTARLSHPHCRPASTYVGWASEGKVLGRGPSSWQTLLSQQAHGRHVLAAVVVHCPRISSSV